MPFVLDHDVVSRRLDIVRHESADGVRFTVETQGSFDVLHPGPLIRDVSATVRHSMRIPIPDVDLPELPPVIDGVPTRPPGGGGIPHPLHNGVVVNVEGIPFDFRIFDPDGQLFTRDEVTLADLKRFRDERGKSRAWSYLLRGASKTYVLVEAFNETVGEPEGAINLTIRETVASTSAPPLIPRTRLGLGPKRLTFDLNRVGVFVARVRGLFDTWQGSMRLIDPDGGIVRETENDLLRCPIPLSLLAKSRDTAGNPRLWTLEVSPRLGVVFGEQHVTANVRGEGRIRTGQLHERIQRIFGPDGTFVKLAGAKSTGRAEVHVTIDDVTAAETIDMHGLLDSRLKAQGQPTDIVAFEPMKIYSRDSEIGYGASVDASGIATTSISVTVGPAQRLPAGTPALRLSVGVQGAVKVRWGGLTLATATANGGQPVEAEIGMRIDADGTPRFESWFPEKPFDIDFHEGAIAAFVATAAAIGAAGGPVGVVAGIFGASVTVDAVEDAIENYLGEEVHDGAKKLFDDPTLAPRILMMMLGTHLTYLPVRFDGDDILFEHVAPLEPDPKPRENYAGAIGRTILDIAAGHTVFRPRTLGDTWAADNLKAKIKHIVVVMMENRSYDHVLGSRSIAPSDPRDEADGWTPNLIAAVNTRAEGFRPPPPPPLPPDEKPIHFDMEPPVGPMRNSSFDPNVLGLRTRLPHGVGHELADVAEQLSEQMDGPGNRRVNDPSGFINNFREHRLGNNPYGDQTTRAVPFDVLRYYGAELPMYGFLAENYGYSDRYFCSHPGPTLPNRMYQLTGDVQYDRYGFPILENNNRDNFLLSRAQTIYDVLTRHGVTWRVYESAPSVTMLRMFARYATDDQNIRPFTEFLADAAAGQLPSFTVVDPAMHHHPQDDDHPDADMSRGQRFIWSIYDALTKNEMAWNETLLLITYDEHGGLYDHVIPPIADVFQGPELVTHPGNGPVLGDVGDDGGGEGEGGISVGGTHVGGLDDILGGTIRGEILADGGRLHDVLGSPVDEILVDGGGLHDHLGDPLGEIHELTEAPVHVPYGVRVPTFVVSPWTPPGKGPGITLDHCSIVKTVLARFCADTKPFFSDRVNASLTFESYVSEPAPRSVGQAPEPPDIPITEPRRFSPTTEIVTKPLFRQRMREEQVDYHEISGRLARMLGR